MEGTKVVLVSEGDPKVRAFVRLWLSRSKYSVIEVSDGVSALEAIGKSNPDLVVTGLVLQKMDGVSLINEIRKSKDPSVKNIPVIVHTALGEKDQARALKAGATVILQKPSLHRRFLGAVESCFS